MTEPTDPRPTLTAALDQSVIDCPQCGGQLRSELREEWRTLLEACEALDCPPSAIRASGAIIDGFGRVKSLIPYVTCMGCGMHADASKPVGEGYLRT